MNSFRSTAPTLTSPILFKVGISLLPSPFLDWLSSFKGLPLVWRANRHHLPRQNFMQPDLGLLPNWCWIL
ncbi:hypothetical protein RMATCC62417_13438 [Rhizopus microsporus]|nr:hypothetical protein RMATCC62417_13438 [Rhizopus microsporus]